MSAEEFPQSVCVYTKHMTADKTSEQYQLKKYTTKEGEISNLALNIF
jgi:hypothetical protein